MYERINQYHVVMEIDPRFQQDPEGLKNIYVPSSNGPARAAQRLHALRALHHVIGGLPSGTIPCRDHFLQHGARSFRSATPSPPMQQAEHELGMPSSIHAGFQGAAQAFQDSLATEPYLILAALVTVYIVLGMLYENYVHPITILSTLPSAGVGALLALLVTHIQLDIVALIGIILLIGIVKKNAILMIDFAIQAERNEDNNPRAVHLSSLPAALSAHHDDHHGRPLWRPAHRVRHRKRLGTSPAAGNRHRAAA